MLFSTFLLTVFVCNLFCIAWSVCLSVCLRVCLVQKYVAKQSSKSLITCHSKSLHAKYSNLQRLKDCCVKQFLLSVKVGGIKLFQTFVFPQNTNLSYTHVCSLSGTLIIAAHMYTLSQ